MRRLVSLPAGFLSYTLTINNERKYCPPEYALFSPPPALRISLGRMFPLPDAPPAAGSVPTADLCLSFPEFYSSGKKSGKHVRSAPDTCNPCGRTNAIPQGLFPAVADRTSQDIRLKKRPRHTAGKQKDKGLNRFSDCSQFHIAPQPYPPPALHKCPLKTQSFRPVQRVLHITARMQHIA